MYQLTLLSLAPILNQASIQSSVLTYCNNYLLRSYVDEISGIS